MKPTVMANTAANSGSNGGGATTNNGVTIPISHEYRAQQPQQHQHHYNQQQPHSQYHEPQMHQKTPQQQQFADNATGYGSPSGNRQYPAHFEQDFGFEPPMDEMFPRRRIGRMEDPFTGFGTHFDFPEFGTLGRRRATAGQPSDARAPMGHDDHDFFNRLPTQFRQYIPEGFGHTRRSGAASSPPQQNQMYSMPQPQHQKQFYANPNNIPPNNGTPQSPSKKLCDAAIQTEDISRGGGGADQHNQHAFRNTVDMGAKSMPDAHAEHDHRAHSAPPDEQMQHQHYHQPQPSMNMNGKRVTPPPVQFGYHDIETSPQATPQAQEMPFQRSYYPPQQKRQTPPPAQAPPQTPGGSYVRTIPIFVEGRSEPIINSHKEIPNQNSPSGVGTGTSSHRGYGPQQQQRQQQQQYRPTPLNTQQHAQQQQQQQQKQQGSTSADNTSGAPPQTPHTMDSINKIQDIQRDVLDLMSKVEKFQGKRHDKEYVYLDEMLTRNLLKLDTIDTNGKESIRLARKEAIKCIQASINVLEAKAEENARIESEAGTSAAITSGHPEGDQPVTAELTEATEELDVTKDKEADQQPKQEEVSVAIEQQPTNATTIKEPIPLPPPENSIVVEDQNQENIKILETEEDRKVATSVQEAETKRNSQPREEETKSTAQNSSE